MDKFASLFAQGGLSLDRLRTICRVADAGGLSRAADGDAAQMSLFSRQIRELETFFGTALTRRKGKGIALTKAGEELARLARVQLAALDDFRRACRAEPQHVTIGSSESVLHWLVVPQLGALRARVPDTEFELAAVRTRDLAMQLSSLALDVALIREDAVAPPIESRTAMPLGFALFVPVALAGGLTPRNLRTRIAALPIAISRGGQFRAQLESSAARAGWPLRFVLHCSSSTESAAAVRHGSHAAILPTIAAATFDPSLVRRFALPFLDDYGRTLAVAWNPRLVETRPLVGRVVAALVELLAPLAVRG
ncbi:MAG: LysR family transcriptional regulator [Chthoniobacteraceae bacterium]